jgi:hypothetical protein
MLPESDVSVRVPDADTNRPVLGVVILPLARTLRVLVPVMFALAAMVPPVLLITVFAAVTVPLLVMFPGARRSNVAAAADVPAPRFTPSSSLIKTLLAAVLAVASRLAAVVNTLSLVLVPMKPRSEIRVAVPAAEMILPLAGVVRFPLARTVMTVVPVASAVKLIVPAVERMFVLLAVTVALELVFVIFPEVLRTKLLPAETGPPITRAPAANTSKMPVADELPSVRALLSLM